jgi:hypothetical protein
MAATHTTTSVTVEAFQVTAANVADAATWPTWVTGIQSDERETDTGAKLVHYVTLTAGAIRAVIEDTWLYMNTEGDPEYTAEDPGDFGTKFVPVEAPE